METETSLSPEALSRKEAGFRRYDHLERLGHRNTSNIEMGLVHVFPKLDGTNAAMWHDPISGNIQAGSRNRVLSLESDNAGFCAWVTSGDPSAESLRQLLSENPNWIIYGEWMVPHTLKTYREEVWRKFWIFDVYDRTTGTYVSYETYVAVLATENRLLDDPDCQINVIEPLCTIQDPSEDQLRAQVETNTYLIADGAGLGEGVVLKNYAWRQHGCPWAKVVRNSFKEDAARTFGHAEKEGNFQVEVAIAEEFVTAHLVGKTRAKVLLDLANDLDVDTIDPNWQVQLEAENRGRVIPQLLGRVYHDLIEEEMWAILKKHKGCTINFKTLNARVIMAVKALASDLF